MARERKKGYFKLKHKIEFSEITEDTLIPESDLCFQDDYRMYQFEYTNPEEKEMVSIEPGTFSFTYVNQQLALVETSFKTKNLLASVVNTKAITEESDLFFDNLNIYEELEQPKARKILLYSDPGMGKSAAIAEYCNNMIKRDGGTVVIKWPTSEVESDDVLNFLSKRSEYLKECTKLILVMEDIGGGEREGSYNSRAVDSAMLDLLDGLEVTFKLPTLILATTNYPQNLLSALADRPGRFDLLKELEAPNKVERVNLAEFFNKKKLDNKAKKAIEDKAEGFSIAHIQEVIIRSRLKKKHIAEIVDEVNDHRSKYSKSFEKGGEMGFGY